MKKGGRLLWNQKERLGPILGYVASVIAMYFYPLSRQGEVEMQEQLNALDISTSEDDLNI
jgi:GPH family glycoside/pentoside/hexuronide:cation symporter